MNVLIQLMESEDLPTTKFEIVYYTLTYFISLLIFVNTIGNFINILNQHLNSILLYFILGQTNRDAPTEWFGIPFKTYLRTILQTYINKNARLDGCGAQTCIHNGAR